MGGELLVPDSREISKEQLIELNPDALFVVVIEGNYDKADQVLSYFYNERAFDSVDCVKITGSPYCLCIPFTAPACACPMGSTI